MPLSISSSFVDPPQAVAMILNLYRYGYAQNNGGLDALWDRVRTRRYLSWLQEVYNLHSSRYPWTPPQLGSRVLGRKHVLQSRIWRGLIPTKKSLSGPKLRPNWQIVWSKSNLGVKAPQYLRSGTNIRISA